MSPEMEEMSGLPPGGFPKTIEAFLDVIRPGDRSYTHSWLSNRFESGGQKANGA
jgi:hypothetical protein